MLRMWKIFSKCLVDDILVQKALTWQLSRYRYSIQCNCKMYAMPIKYYSWLLLLLLYGLHRIWLISGDVTWKHGVKDGETLRSSKTYGTLCFQEVERINHMQSDIWIFFCPLGSNDNSLQIWALHLMIWAFWSNNVHHPTNSLLTQLEIGLVHGTMLSNYGFLMIKFSNP